MSTPEVPPAEGLPQGVLPEGVHVGWFGAETGTGDALRTMLGGESIETGHLCSRCGSDEHGAPWAVRLGVRVAASAARAGGSLVVVTRTAATPSSAIRPVDRIGVDVERRGADIDAAVVLHPDDALPTDLAAAWAGKEAIAKWLGTGLRTPPSTLRAADFELRETPAPDGLVAVVCLGRAGGTA